MDSASVISIVPIAINERKPMLPAEFRFLPARVEEPFILLLGKGINDIYVGEGRGHYGPDRSVIRVPIDAEVVAESIVTDWVDVQYGIMKPHAVPGLFWMPGEVTIEQLIGSEELQRADHYQLNWFKNLVKLADDDWNKYRQHKTISDIQRYAAGFLKLERPWLLDTEIVQAMSECPSCFEKVNPRAIVCSHCRFVLDKPRYDRAQFSQVS